MTFDIDLTKEVMGDGDVIAHLTVTLGDTKKSIGIDLGKMETPGRMASAIRFLADFIERDNGR